MTVPIIIAAATVLIVLGIGGALTTVGPWYRGLNKPAWNPPDWLFGPAWAVILSLAGWAGVLAWVHTVDAAVHMRIGLLFCATIVLHMLWSPLFFNLRRPDWSLIQMPFFWVSIAALMVGVAPVSPLAAWLLLPYLLWVTFAAALNLKIVLLNPSFRPHGPDH